MAEALIRGIIASGIYRENDILVAEPNDFRRDHLEQTYSVKTYHSNLPIFENCRIVILAVKPQTMKALLEDCRDRVQTQHIIISIAAGTADFFLSPNDWAKATQKSSGSCPILRLWF